ncbi:MAG: hypothetical protein IPN26_04655 [Bacteroidetes bacterium]|nr:hypothetical protein [Bacteroidota bacterium]
MSLAWGANMAYLLYKLLFSSNNYAYPNLVIPFFDTLSGILFLGAVFLPPKGEFSFRNNQKNFFLFFLIFILCYLLELSFRSIGDLAFIKLSAMPAFVFDSLVLYLVAKYFKGLERSIYKVYWLTNSFYAYALIQILAIFSYEKVFELFGWSITVETIGFSIGLLVKAVILFSFVKVLLLMIKDIQKLNHKLEYQSVLTIKLNQIIGRTFHEITPVIGYMENQIDGLLNKNDEFQLNRRTISYIQEIEYNTYRLKTILSAATKMYHKDMKDEPASDKFSYPIQIVEQEEVVNINTLLEIAITNFKAYISILRNPNVSYSELEKNFMTTNDVNFKTQYGRNCLVFGNSAEFVQIFYNAFKNSYESMLEQTDRSQIFVRTKTSR